MPVFFFLFKESYISIFFSGFMIVVVIVNFIYMYMYNNDIVLLSGSESLVVYD